MKEYESDLLGHSAGNCGRNGLAAKTGNELKSPLYPHLELGEPLTDLGLLRL